jgi:hypothetical protein
MASLEAIRDAIETTLTALEDLRGHGLIPDQVSPPAAIVTPVDADYDVAFGRGLDTWNFDLLVVVGRAEIRSGQKVLDQYVDGKGSKSIRQHIFNNKTLGLANTDAHVSGMSGYGATYELNTIQYLGAKLRLVVHTSGTE